LPDGTIFGQNMDRACEEMRRLFRRFEAEWHYQRAWFDGVYAVDGGGLGAHYDQSDVFLIQQEGRKLWRLHAPDFIPESELRLHAGSAERISVRAA
jgi:ribosomal protein L16 Arg81 hydroxylase